MNFVIVSREFGYPIYLSGVGDISDKRADAMLFVEGQDNGAIKARYASALFGYTFAVEAA